MRGFLNVLVTILRDLETFKNNGSVILLIDLDVNPSLRNSQNLHPFAICWRNNSWIEWINHITDNPQIWDPCLIMLVAEDLIFIHDLMMHENLDDLR